MNSAHPVAAALRAVAFGLLAGAGAFGQSTAPTLQWTTIAGRASIGMEDGPGTAARFHHPRGLAFDPAGNLYIADTNDHAIRKLTPAGVVSTLAGSPGQPGSVDGIGAAARFNSPEGVAVDAMGNVYVADTGNATIRMIAPGGVVTTLAGQAGHTGTADGGVATALFTSPRKIAVDGSGSVYVLDAGIRRISGGTVQTIFGSVSATLTSPVYVGPVRLFDSALAVDAAGQIYFEGEVRTPPYNIPASAVLKMAAGGTVSVVSILPQLPWGGNEGLLATDPGGNLWGTESEWKNHGSRDKVVRFHPDGSTDAVGVVRDAAGAEEHAAMGLAVTPTGGLVYSRDDNVIVKMEPDGTQVILAGTPQGTLRDISSIAVDSTGNVWAAGTEVGFSDELYFTALEIATAPMLLKRSADGSISTPIRPGFDFSYPVDYLAVAVDRSDNVYFAGVYVMHPPVLDKIAPGGVITSAALSLPESPFGAGHYGLGAFVVDTAGDLIVPDSGNHVVWKRTPDDRWSVLAGQPGMSGPDDGTGDRARFGYLGAITADRSGNFYVVDTQYAATTPESFTIRRITPGGAVTTVTANLLEIPGLEGLIDGYAPGIAIDSHGAFYLTHGSDCTVWRITAQGEAAVIGGASLQEGSADGPGTAARFVQPLAIAVDTRDNIYVSDGGYRSPTIRKGRLPEPPVITAQPQSVAVTAGTDIQFSVGASGAPAPTYQWYFNGAAIGGATGTTLSIPGAQPANAGQYTVVVSNALGSVTSNAATLTVSPAPTPTPGPTAGGGGGATSNWFLGLLAALAAARCLQAGLRSGVFVNSRRLAVRTAGK